MKNFFKSILVLAIIITIAQINLTAQNWEQIDGPYGGAVKQLTAHKNYLYALTYEQIYRSSDDGTTWKNVQTKQDLIIANAITSQNGMLFLATSYEGILRSTDDGISWQKQNNGLLNDKSMTNIISNGSTLLAQSYNNFLFKSTDNGANWEICIYDSISTNQPLYTCKIIKSDGTNFYILAKSPINYTNIYKSMDNGFTWQKTLLDQPFKNQPAIEVAKDFSIKDSTIIFCGTGINYTIETTTDLGKTWLTSTNNFSHNNITCLINTGTTIICGLNRNNYDSNNHQNGFSFVISKNNGITWDTLNPKFRNINSFYQYKNYLFATTFGEEGILRSTDNGLNWDKSNFGLNANDILQISISKQNQYLIVNQNIPMNSTNITSYNIFKNSNNLSWEKLSDSLNFYIFPTICNDSLLISNENGTYLTNDFGKTWNLQSSQTFNQITQSSDKVLLGIKFQTNNQTNNGEIYRSTDFGKNWQISSLIYENLLYDFSFYNNSYYIIYDDLIYKSIDTCLTWQAIKQPKDIHHIFTNSKYLFVSNSKNLFKLNFDGSGWDTLNTPSNENNFYFLGFQNNSDVILCSTNANELYFSNDQGSTWVLINKKLPSNYINSILVADNKIYLSTIYIGAWTLDLTKTDVENNVTKSQYELAVYPNPSQGKFIVERRNIEFSSNLPVKYSLKSITGQEVLSLISSDEKLEIKTDNFPSGIYYLTAEENSNSVIQMITILK